MILLSLLLAAATPEPEATRSFYLQLIHQARADGRPRAAIAYLDDFDRRYPGDTDARLLRVNSLIDLGDIPAAQAAATTLSPGAGTSATQGHLLAARNRWSEAIPFYRAALEANPTDPLLRNALGYAQLRARRPAEAVETLRAAADLAPGEPVIRNNLLLALSLAGRRAELDAALARIPDPALRAQIAAETTRLERQP